MTLQQDDPMQSPEAIQAQAAQQPPPETREHRTRYRVALIIETLDQTRAPGGEWEEHGGERLVELSLGEFDGADQAEVQYEEAAITIDEQSAIILLYAADETRWPGAPAPTAGYAGLDDGGDGSNAEAPA